MDTYSQVNVQLFRPARREVGVEGGGVIFGWKGSEICVQYAKKEVSENVVELHIFLPLQEKGLFVSRGANLASDT